MKQETVEKISKYFRLTRFEAEKIFDEVFSIIAQGVKDDNIVDVANFGEFIIKYDNEKSSGEVDLNDEYYKRTVEFLASSGLEEDLNENMPGKIVTGSIPGSVISQEKNEISGVPPKSSVEDELRSKREALLSKISIHPLRDAEEEKKIHEEESAAVLPPPVQETLETKPDIPVQEIEEDTSESVPQGEPLELGAETRTPFPDEIVSSGFEEDVSKKSFSDFFAEVKETGKPAEEISRAPAGSTEDESTGAGVLPKTAIDLHNEITGAEKETVVSEPPVAPPTEKLYEDKSLSAGSDKSYYIWYKDSESTPAETQNLSYEYELLYQATKEAEYKSKLKIYVSTFILFFSIVLILLIFSPVIYKVFFTPIELQSIENLREDAGVNQSSFEQEAFRNPRQETTPQNLPPVETPTKSETPPVTEQQSGQQEVQKPQQTQVTEEPKIEGVTKNAMGWSDEKFRVIYVKLDNGKYAIQESSWDSEAKANKRIALIESYKISGLKGSIAKVEVSGKGTWYRVRLGEFSTVQEARTKAEELRNKTKS